MAADTFTAKLDEMIQFADKGIVSKSIYDSKHSKVVLFCFEEGQFLSEHTAPFDAAVYILEGEARITIDGEPHTVKGGEMIIMPANKSHALKAVTRYKMLLVMIK